MPTTYSAISRSRNLTGTRLKKARRQTRRKYRAIGGKEYEQWKNGRKELMAHLMLRPSQQCKKLERLTNSPSGYLKEFQAFFRSFVAK